MLNGGSTPFGIAFILSRSTRAVRSLQFEQGKPCTWIVQEMQQPFKAIHPLQHNILTTRNFSR